MKFDKVMVTGGAGFIGSHTVDALLNEGTEVWVLDDMSTGSGRNLRAWKANRRLHSKQNTVTKYRLVESLAKKVDAIVHLAAVVSPFASIRKPEIVNEVNVTGTVNVLRAALNAGVERVVYASSSSVYGNQTILPISETNPLQPITPYGASKLSGEKYCGAFYETFGLETVSLRYFNVYGARQSANPYSGVIAIFANRLRRGLRPKIFGDGTQSRDFIHVSDLVNANLQAMHTHKGIGEAFNIGTGQATSINFLVTLLAELLGKTALTPLHAQARRGDIRHSFGNISKAKDAMGFEPNVELKRGLQLLLGVSSEAKGLS